MNDVRYIGITFQKVTKKKRLPQGHKQEHKRHTPNFKFGSPASEPRYRGGAGASRKTPEQQVGKIEDQDSQISKNDLQPNQNRCDR